MKQYKFIPITAMFCLICSGVWAQSVAKSVVASGGGSYSGPAIKADWTIGQAVTNYAATSSVMVTEGFLPITNNSVNKTTTTNNAVKSVYDNGLALTAYPNPVNNVLHISGQQNTAQALSVQVKDILGKTLNAITIPADVSISSDIDFSQFPNGIYLIIVSGDYGNAQVMKVVKN